MSTGTRALPRESQSSALPIKGPGLARSTELTNHRFSLPFFLLLAISYFVSLAWLLRRTDWNQKPQWLPSGQAIWTAQRWLSLTLQGELGAKGWEVERQLGSQGWSDQSQPF